MLASWVLPGWMSDIQEQLKETLGMVVAVVAVVVVFLLPPHPPLYFGTREKRLKGGEGEKCVCSGEEEEWAVESAKKQDMEGCVSFEGGVKATHRNGIL